MNGTKNFKVVLEYDGSEFFGWDKQKSKRTVRGELERILSNIFCMDVKILAAARTDKGVHAINQVANFRVNTRLDCAEILRAMNALLPSDIYVKNIETVASEFDARRAAKSKCYFYRIHRGYNCFLRKYAWLLDDALNIDRIQSVLPYFRGRHNFGMFAYRDAGVCEIFDIGIMNFKGEIIFYVAGDRFLHKMVRMIVGALVEVGRNKLDMSDIKSMLANQGQKPTPAPPEGLYLLGIKF